MKSIENKIINSIRGRGRGSIVFQSDYADYGAPAAVKTAFHRLCLEGTLLRLAKGIYYYPKIDTELGLGMIYPSIDQIAEAISRRDHVKIVPTGAYALNRLGLSDQVPMNAVFVTNGAPRRIQVGGRNGILFRHSSSGKLFAFKSDIMMMIASAMKEIGKDAITDEQMAVIKDHLRFVSEKDYAHDIKLVPAWIRQILMTR